MNPSHPEQPFTDEELRNIIALGAVLRKVHKRLREAGFTLETYRAHLKELGHDTLEP